jgi:hypothetical protein
MEGKSASCYRINCTAMNSIFKEVISSLFPNLVPFSFPLPCAGIVHVFKLTLLISDLISHTMGRSLWQTVVITYFVSVG